MATKFICEARSAKRNLQPYMVAHVELNVSMTGVVTVFGLNSSVKGTLGSQLSASFVARRSISRCVVTVGVKSAGEQL